MPSGPVNTSAWTCPSRCSTSAIIGARRAFATPSELMAHARGIRERAEHVEHGANAELAAHRDRRDAAPDGTRARTRKPMPASSTQRRTPSGDSEITTPSASSTSALPHRDEAARLPCLATGHPAPAATSAAAVEMLKVPAPSPPVPHVSTASTESGTTVAWARIDSTMPGELVNRLALRAQRGDQRADLGRRRLALHHRCPSPRALSACRGSDRRRPPRVPAASPPHPSRATVAPSVKQDDPYTRRVTARTLDPFDPEVVAPWRLGDGPRGALLIHGFASTPPELRRLGEVACRATGFRCHAPALPGHGTTPQDLERTRWQDWAAARRRRPSTSSPRECSDVVVAGQSMGGTLALHLAAHDLRVRAVATLAAPIWLSGPLPPLLPLHQASRALAPHRRRRRPLESRTPSRSCTATGIRPTRSIDELRRVCAVVRNELAEVRAPVLSCTASAIEPSIRAARREIARRLINSEAVQLRDAAAQRPRDFRRRRSRRRQRRHPAVVRAVRPGGASAAAVPRPRR